MPVMVPANRPVSRVLLPSHRRTAAAVLAGFGWAWAYGLIATHEHLLEQYCVFCSRPLVPSVSQLNLPPIC
jgi:hypothetical protein